MEDKPDMSIAEAWRRIEQSLQEGRKQVVATWHDEGTEITRKETDFGGEPTEFSSNQ